MLNPPPELAPFPEHKDTAAEALALLSWSRDFLAWLHNWTTPIFVKSNNYPLPMEAYVILEHAERRLAAALSNLPPKENGASCQNAPKAIDPAQAPDQIQA